MKSHLPFAILLVAVTGAAANAQYINLKDAPCHNAASGAEEARCLIAAAKAADTAIGQQIKRIGKVLTDKEWVHLKLTQSRWTDFREADCNAERELYGSGAIASIAYYACLEAHARQRLADLRVAYGWRLENIKK